MQKGKFALVAAAAAILLTAGASQAQGQRQTVEELLREDAEMALNGGKKVEPVQAVAAPAYKPVRARAAVVAPLDAITVSRIVGLSTSEVDRRKVDLQINGQRARLAIGDSALSWRLIDIAGKCVTLVKLPAKAKGNKSTRRTKAASRARSKPRTECIEFEPPQRAINFAAQVPAQSSGMNAIPVTPMPSPIYRAPEPFSAASYSPASVAATPAAAPRMVAAPMTSAEPPSQGPSTLAPH